MAVLRHGLFDFTDHNKYATLIHSERTTDVPGEGTGGVAQPTKNHNLRREAVRVRKEVREAKKLFDWHSNGWELQPWQTRKVMLLQNGDLDKKKRAANKAYGHGVGVSTGLSKEQAMTLAIFTNDTMTNFFNSITDVPGAAIA